MRPRSICCSGERGIGERKRGYQAGFSEQVINLFVLKLNSFNSYIHFFKYSSIIFSISICSLPLLKLKLPHKPRQERERLMLEREREALRREREDLERERKAETWATSSLRRLQGIVVLRFYKKYQGKKMTNSES